MTEPRAGLDPILRRMRVLALERFPGSAEALEAFFETAAMLARDAWPEPAAPAAAEGPEDEGPDAPEDEDEAEDEDEDAEEPEPAPDPGAARVALMEHLVQLEELLEALQKTAPARR